MSRQPTVDPDGVRTFDAPQGFVAIRRRSGTCSSAVDFDRKCDLHKTFMCSHHLCSGGNRLDRKHVIFLASAANGAMAAATPPLFQSAAQQSPGLKPHEILQNIISEAEAVKKLKEAMANNNLVNAEDAPAGMRAMASFDGCQGCYYLKGKADCTRSSSVSCTELGRNDAQNVVFIPRV
jgi:hypothetical protein